MSVENYGVLKCRAIATRLERKDETPHFQVHCVDGEKNHYRLVINVMSKEYPSELLYLIDEDFSFNKISVFPTSKIFTPLDKGLDYIRDNLFEPSNMIPLAFDIPGNNNDLLEVLDKHIQDAIRHQAYLYVFGSRFENLSGKDRIFKFFPLVGMHNIHMNQGNSSHYEDNDAAHRDGALFIHYPEEDKCIAIFLAFQSQSWCTDDNGHRTRDCDHNHKSFNTSTI